MSISIVVVVIKREEARAEIIKKWLRLAPAERANEHQAFMFAMRVAREYNIKVAGDRYQHVMGWLSPHIGKE